MNNSWRNKTHVKYFKVLPNYRQPHKLRKLAKVPFELGCKQKGWA